jgi:peptide/nickel transport system substrate-binding protein
VLGEVDPPQLDNTDPLSVIFTRTTPDAVARALASPLLALVPRGFSPLAPDGTGAFRVELAKGRALFTRNLNAARGPSYLDAIEVTSASDLADLLRGFESGVTDVGWFGAGLYRSVKDAVAFETPRYALAVLIPGKAAGAWAAPGTLQPLLDGIPAQQLAHLGLRGLPTSTSGSTRWGGPATNVLVLAGAPQLVALARSVAAALSTPGHELSVLEKSAEELNALRASRQFGLLVDCVRAAGSSERELEQLLRTAASPEAAARAPKTAPMPPRQLARQLSLGVIGELSVHGSRGAALLGLESWQLGAVALAKP